MTPPRVLTLYSTLAVGGAERQLEILATGLQVHGTSNWLSPHFAIEEEHFESLRDSGFVTAHANMQSRTDVAGAVRGYRLWRNRPVLVLTQSVNAHVIGHAIARRAGAAHVAVEQGPGAHLGPQQRGLTRLVARRVDRVVAVSRAQIPELRSLGYRAEAIEIIPNGSTEPVPSRSSAEVRRELGLGEHDIVVLLVGCAPTGETSRRVRRSHQTRTCPRATSPRRDRGRRPSTRRDPEQRIGQRRPAYPRRAFRCSRTS